MTKAIFMVLMVWCYTVPWAVFPLLELWGRFVPGEKHSYCIRKNLKKNQIFLFFNFIKCLEGYLTACTFDYLTDTFDTQMFVAVIFTFSYCIPMLLIMYYYSQIVQHVFNHEKALRAQVS